MKVTLGGDRLGSGKKQKLELSHYYRSSFNLEQDWKSSMAPGVLYPCLNLVGTNGDTFDIDMDSFLRTLPTKGPLFGSFKFQVDLFACPFRLYQGILHNNPVNIGLKMNQVYLPKLKIYQDLDMNISPINSDFYTKQIATNSLLKYIGLSGIGTPDVTEIWEGKLLKRKINAIPVLAYYDIFKNYYANKQEENAYVITPDSNYAFQTGITETVVVVNDQGEYTPANMVRNIPFSGTKKIIITGKNIDFSKYTLTFYDDDAQVIDTPLNNNLKWLEDNGYIKLEYNTYSDQPSTDVTITFTDILYAVGSNENFIAIKISYTDSAALPNKIKLYPFALENIDKMRNRILKLNELGDELVIDNTETLFPYAAVTKIELVPGANRYVSWNAFDMNGLVVKTYQSDLFNNWINTDWIEGENGIAAITAVNVSGGTLQMDALNLAQKVYNMLNRVAVNGGTYEDWQEAVYDEKAVRKAESPMYIGGMSAEVMFEEVISNSETKIDGDFQPLGALGGKGTQVGKKGGNNITVHCTEPTFIMGIVSLTPRICQTQGNEWYLTDLDTLDDLHKPGLDGIGFQDLIVEQFAWWDTKLDPNNPIVTSRSRAGKVPAWINYTTAVDKAFGDFAQANGKAFMVLARNYEAEYKEVDEGVYDWVVKDVTTYIDPGKYNYAFAYDELAAQNFWTQIHFNIVARRKMSAHQIPNL